MDIKDLLRQHGKEGLVSEAEAAGLSPRGGRMRCPQCVDQGPSRPRNASLTGSSIRSDIPKWRCWRCGSGGDLADLLKFTRGWQLREATEHLAGLTPPPPRPVAFKVIRPADDPEKLSPADVKRLWDALAKTDEAGLRYLEGRGLEAAAEAGLVRFATEAHPDRRVASLARRGYRIAALMADVTGNPRGIQLRLARDARAKENKILSVKGSSTSRAFFGDPGVVEAEPLTLVAEGLADTLALAAWAGKWKGAVVVGAAGKNNLAHLAEELASSGLEDLEGRVFCLFPQNDRPQNVSRREFVRLSQLLAQKGAHVVMVATDPEFKDLAEWRRARPEVPWPPPEVQRALLPDVDDEVPPEARLVTPNGCAVPIPEQIRSDNYAQNFTTLCALLDDPVHREAIMGRGQLSWCEMTWRVRLGAKELSEVDLSTIRLGIEGQGRSTDNKPLKFAEEEVARGLAVIARKRTVHPVRDWLSALKWDGKPRLGDELAGALGHGEGSFAGTLLSRWLVSAVARAMEPGCKVDTVLVLVGAQGVGKSTFFSVLGGSWFTDSPVNVEDNNAKLIMRRAWIVEWAELEAMRRARAQEALKAFLSARIDIFRKPYGRDVVEAPRHCVIVGTTNNREFLHDPTGSRRFWPVEVTKLELSWVKENREQLFAEAVARYRTGEQWWLTTEEDAELARVNREHEAQDVWADPVADWLSERPFLTEVTSAQLLHEALGKEMDSWTTEDARRVGAVVRGLGWEPAVKRFEGGRRRFWARPGAS